MVAEFMEFETPNEPQMGTVSSIQDKYNSMMLDLNDDLQDEIGTRREQFDSISKTCDDLYSRIERVDVEMMTRTERNLKLAVIGMTMGMIGICASVASMIL
jgi:archaellum component FlaC